MTTIPTEQKNNASRLSTLIKILDDEIKAHNLIGIAMWSDEASNCMIHIEVDNNITGVA